MIWQIKQHTPQPVNSTAYRFTKAHNYVQYWTSPKQVTLYQPAITYSAAHILLTSLPKNHFPSWVRDCTTVETRHHPTHAYSWAATPHIMVRRQRRMIEPLDQVRHAKFNIIALSTSAFICLREQSSIGSSMQRSASVRISRSTCVPTKAPPTSGHTKNNN